MIPDPRAVIPPDPTLLIPDPTPLIPDPTCLVTETLLCCYDAKMLRYYDVENYRCYAVTMLLLLCYALNDVTVLQCYDIKMILRYYAVTMLRFYDV